MRWPAAVSVALTMSALLAQPGLRDAVTGAPGTGARLVLPRAYVVLAPVCDVLDTLALLSARQHLALAVSVLAAAMVVAATRAGRRGHRRPAVHCMRQVAGAVVTTLLGLVATYAVCAFVPRPMVALELDDPAELTLDVHSHTSASHDGRAGFGPEENRAWHHASGFDVAYVTDHRSLAAAARAARTNPRLAGDGTVLLSGIETVYKGQHINVLGVAAPDSAIDRLGRLDDLTFRATTHDGIGAPVSILTIPAHLNAIPAGVRLRGIEISDAAPRGLDATGAHRARLLQLADSLDLAVLAGSDNHGWGRTAAAWTVMRIPGWRVMRPAAVDSAIRTALDRDRRRSTRVIDRAAVASSRSNVRLAVTVPLIAWNMATTLSGPERASWLAWAWLAWLGHTALRWRRASAPARTAVRPEWPLPTHGL